MGKVQEKSIQRKRSHMDPSIPRQLDKNGEYRIRQSETSDKEVMINLPLSVTRAKPGDGKRLPAIEVVSRT